MEIASLVARGLPDKVIATRIDLSVHTVHRHIQEAAARIPGDSSPRHRLTLFFLQLEADSAA